MSVKANAPEKAGDTNLIWHWRCEAQRYCLHGYLLPSPKESQCLILIHLIQLYPYGKRAGDNKFGLKSCPTCGKPATHPTKEEYPRANAQIPADGFFMFKDELSAKGILYLWYVPKFVKMECLAMNDRIPEQHGTIQYGIGISGGYTLVNWNNYEYVHDDYDGLRIARTIAA